MKRPCFPRNPSARWNRLESGLRNSFAGISRTRKQPGGFSPTAATGCCREAERVTGRLLGGCLEVFDWLRGTPLFPDPEDFNGAILFLETSEEKPVPKAVRYMLSLLGGEGLLDRFTAGSGEALWRS